MTIKQRENKIKCIVADMKKYNITIEDIREQWFK